MEIIHNFLNYGMDCAYEELFGPHYPFGIATSPAEVGSLATMFLSTETYLSILSSEVSEFLLGDIQLLTVPQEGSIPQPLMFQHHGFKGLLYRLYYSGRYSMAERELWKSAVPNRAIAAAALFVRPILRDRYSKLMCLQFYIVLMQHETGQRNLEYDIFTRSLECCAKYDNIVDAVLRLREYAVSGPIFDRFLRSLPEEFRNMGTGQSYVEAKIYLRDGD